MGLGTCAPASTQLVESGEEAQGKFFGGAAAPVMEKNHRGLSAKHVVVNGDDVQFMSAKRLQHRRNFGFAHGDVAGNLRVGVVSGKSSPGVQPHAGGDRCTVFFELELVAAE